MLPRPHRWAIGTAGLLALGIAVSGCQGHGCEDMLLCTATQEEADRLNATAECPNYGYCPWVAEHGDASGEAGEAGEADAGADVFNDDADTGE